MTLAINFDIISFSSSIALLRTVVSRRLAPRPIMKAKTKAVITPITGGTLIEK